MFSSYSIKNTRRPFLIAISASSFPPINWRLLCRRYERKLRQRKWPVPSILYLDICNYKMVFRLLLLTNLKGNRNFPFSRYPTFFPHSAAFFFHTDATRNVILLGVYFVKDITNSLKFDCRQTRTIL